MANILKDTDAAWLAGLLEGDGSFTHDLKRNIIRIQLSMYDGDVVTRAAELLDTSVVCNDIERGGLVKNIYRTSLARKAEVVDILKQIKPYMGRRRTSRINELLAFAEEYVS